jgi:hypothetical protein
MANKQDKSFLGQLASYLDAQVSQLLKKFTKGSDFSASGKAVIHHEAQSDRAIAAKIHTIRS